EVSGLEAARVFRERRDFLVEVIREADRARRGIPGLLLVGARDRTQRAVDERLPEDVELLPLQLPAHAPVERQVVEEVPREFPPHSLASDALRVVASVPNRLVGGRDLRRIGAVEPLVQVVSADLPLERRSLELAPDVELLERLPGIVAFLDLEEDIGREVAVLVAEPLVAVVGGQCEDVPVGVLGLPAEVSTPRIAG